jgi:hypothetical protein
LEIVVPVRVKDFTRSAEIAVLLKAVNVQSVSSIVEFSSTSIPAASCVSLAADRSDI